VTDAPTVGDDAVLDSIGAILASAMLPTAPAAAPAPVLDAVASPPAPERQPLFVPQSPGLPLVERAAPPAPTAPAVEEPADPIDEAPDREPPSRARLIAEWVGIVGLALLVAILVKLFVISSFAIPSESMYPTLQKGDRVLVNRLSYQTHELRRGDVIVFERPPKSPIDGPDAPKDLIKRVVGLPGDVVATHDGSVWVNGKRLEEPYVAEGVESTGLEEGVKVPANHVWVMGDNRTNSADSRVFGPLSEQLVIGRAFARVWPVGRIGFL